MDIQQQTYSHTTRMHTHTHSHTQMEHTYNMLKLAHFDFDTKLKDSQVFMNILSNFEYKRLMITYIYIYIY